MAVNLYMCLIVALCLTSAVIGGHSLIGGYESVETNRKDVQEAADFALKTYNAETNDANLFRCLHIKSAQIQLVNGRNYKLVMQTGRTSCRKNHVGGYGLGDGCDVAISDVLQVYDCSFVIYKSFSTPNKPQTFSLFSSDCKPQ